MSNWEAVEPREPLDWTLEECFLVSGELCRPLSEVVRDGMELSSKAEEVESLPKFVFQQGARFTIVPEKRRLCEESTKILAVS